MAERVLTADECKMGRAALGWSEADLAHAAAVDIAAVEALERGAGEAAAAARAQAAMAEAGVTFYAGPGGKPYIRARTLDGIIEAPVALSPRLQAAQASVVKR